MYKRSLFTSITPLPKGVSRKAAVAWLHDHAQMIRLNPLVLRLHETTPAANASADEFDCAWYEITDEISYLPGGLYKGEVTYKACFNDLPDGVQTHTFAPAGLDLRGKWTVGGNEPGEPRERLELGSEAPREGLYIREDVDMRCNILLTGFVKKNLTKSHKSVVDKLANLGTSPEATAGGEDFVHSQAHRQNQPLTPVDSSTVFGPDSYATGQSSEFREGPYPRSEPHYVGHHSNSNHQTDTLSLHLRSQIISLDPSPSHAPQLPPLHFSELFRDSTMGPEGSSQHEVRQSNALEAADPATGSGEGFHGISDCVETPSERPSTVTLAHTSGGGRFASNVVAKGASPRELHVPQRVSTDYTWRPGLRPGGFI